MAANTKNIVRDAQGIPAPQYYNPTTDAYEYAQGANGSLNVTLTGNFAAIKQSPVTGIKTVTSTAAEVFAGASRLANRRKMVIKNESADIRVRIGSSNVTVDNGFPLEPGAIIGFDFDPAVAVAIYAISEAGNIQVAVMEV